MKFTQIWTWRRVIEKYGRFKGRNYWYISEENHGTIAELFPYRTPEHTDANARLIAAAPQMYDALEAAGETLEAFGKLATVNEGDVITMLPYHAAKLSRLLNETRPVVQAALAAARGES